MELKLKPSDKNYYPLAGILVKGSSCANWLKQIQWMGIPVDAITVYPLPGNVPNSVWGCLVELNQVNQKIDIGSNVFCQLVNQLLFIPERTNLYPALGNAEIEKLFHGKKHIYHPEFGLVELETPIDWLTMIEILPEIELPVRASSASVFIPHQIKTFQIKPVELDQALEEMDKKYFPKRERFKERPLNPFEKIKLALYKKLFTKVEGKTERTTAFSQLEKIRNMFGKNKKNWAENIVADYEDLEKRNQKQLDRLMDMLKKDPQQALKYAIPLDYDGVTRGSDKGLFRLVKLWFDFSLFGGWGNNSGGGSAMLPGDSFNKLHNQYLNVAEELVKQKDYRKAAFVYMKLLKNYPMAAKVLMDGEHYQEAASVYLKYCSDKEKAAECYEKGQMTEKAIELYKELGQDEKVGDLYLSLHNKKDACYYFQKVTDNYEQKDQYLKASLIYRHKMELPEKAKEVLLKGWRRNKDALNCLNNYFSYIQDTKQLGNEIKTIYHNDVNEVNREMFLQVLKHEFDKKNELSASLKEMAHEIIVAQVRRNPSIVSELRAFNKEDKQLLKDTIRYKINLKQS